MKTNTNMFIKIYFYLAVLCLAAVPVFAQTTLETPKPLELPNFIIEGVEQLNVRTGIKQMPTKTSPLSAEQLDSLNSLEKQSAVLLSPDPLPNRSVGKSFSSGFVRGSLGLYATPELVVGYGKNAGGYQLYGNAGFDISSGDVKGSDYRKFHIKGYSDYIAPEKFYIFGGSRTRTSIFLNNSSYNLYVLPQSQAETSFYDRSATNFGFKLETEGKFENALFNTGLQFRSLQLSSDDKAQSYHASRNAFDTEMQGFLKIKGLWNNYQLAGNMLLDFHSLRTDALSFLQLNGDISYFTKDVTFSGGIGFQSAVNSSGKNRGGLLLKGEIEYRMNQLVTMKGSITSGLENNSFMDYFATNPYLDFSTPVDYMYNIALINGSIILHPNENFTFSGGLKWRIADRMPFFKETVSSTFELGFKQGTVLEIIPEVIWDISSNDRLTANMTYSVGALNDYSGKVPYYPIVKLDLAYRKLFFEKLGTQIGLIYIGERDASVENTDIIDGYFNLNISADFRLNKSFLLFVNFYNLTSSNVYIWNKYKERGLFANLGLQWQF